MYRSISLIIVCFAALVFGGTDCSGGRSSATEAIPVDIGTLPANCANEHELGAAIALIASTKKAEEDSDARKVVCLGVSKNGRPVAVVLFTLESFAGSNLWRQYLATFEVGSDQRLALIDIKEVGGRGIRSVTGLEAGPNVAVLSGLGYGPDDAGCCPSEPSTQRFAIRGGHLEPIASK
ncbi:MAG: hypothetical protein UZ17_ACD001000006 [Acidobacteria bacterium OLB17]|nr:MAG: hypothetical protein UZ17_ACD001000006 [Acidobacteria bacterium OLB17]MCZ2390089.1 hypothetical protein [Acidobacteriota bacterium]